MIYVFWNKYLFLVAYAFRRMKLQFLINPESTNDPVSYYLNKLDIQYSIGSAEEGGRHAALSLLDSLRKSIPVFASANHPLRQVEELRPGNLVLAQQSGIPILPIYCKSLWSIKIKLKTGRFILPLPFNSVEVILGNPVKINPFDDLGLIQGVKNKILKDLDSKD